MNKRVLSIVFSTAILLFLCIALILAGFGISRLPTWAESQFGPSDPEISVFQRIIISAQLLRQMEELKTAADPTAEPQSFQVELGESTRSITNRLERMGLVSNANALRNYLVYAGLDKTIQSGNYQLSPRMTTLEIAHIMQDSTPSEVMFNILPGWRLEELASALPTSGLNITEEEFLAATYTSQPTVRKQFEIPANSSLEGLLLPDQYQISREITAEALIGVFTENFQLKISRDLIDAFRRQGLSPYQALILASIVQREAIVQEEMPIIASVFLNRLKVGMKLDADPTVQYALGYNADQKSWWTNPLSASDLQFDSPYNTYLYPGLPPGPIANPGLKALQAVAYPAETPYYYFRAACDQSGKHNFAQNFEQQLQNACP